jgi:hypothetical protein
LCWEQHGYYPKTRTSHAWVPLTLPISPRLRELAHRLFLLPLRRPLLVSPGVTADITGICGRVHWSPNRGFVVTPKFRLLLPAGTVPKLSTHCWNPQENPETAVSGYL